MAAINFVTSLPLADVNGTFADPTSFTNAMEQLALDGYTRKSDGEYLYQVGQYIDQCEVFHWVIDSANLPTAQSNFNDFKNSITWSTIVPVYYAYSFIANG